MHVFCGLLSYNNKIALNISVDQDINFNPEEFIKLFEDILATEIFENLHNLNEKYSNNS